MDVLIKIINLQTNTLHYVTDGTAKFRFAHKKLLYYVPLMLVLKCLVDVSDKQMYNALIAGCEDDLYYQGCVLNMLRAIHQLDLHSHEQCKAYMGRVFRVKIYELFDDASDSEVCDFILKWVEWLIILLLFRFKRSKFYKINILLSFFFARYCVAIHLDSNAEKYDLLVYMTKKLFAFANNKCAYEGADAVMMQECLLGGHLYLQVLKEKLYDWLGRLRFFITKRAKVVGNNYALTMRK